MDFYDIDTGLQKDILSLLNDHISISTEIIKADHQLLPMLALPDSKQLFSLQPKGEKTDVDKAYASVINKLKTEVFSYALFSYSTKVVLENGKASDVIKTVVFTSSGLEFSFFTPYVLKGFFKKSIEIQQTIFGEIKEKFFD